MKKRTQKHLNECLVEANVPHWSLRGTYFIVRAVPPSEMYGYITVESDVRYDSFLPRSYCYVILHITHIAWNKGLMQQDRTRKKKREEDKRRG